MRSFVTLCFLLFWIVLAAEPSPAPMRKMVASIETPATGAPKSVSNWILTLGKGSLHLIEGQVIPFLDGEKIIGFYFKGKGEFSLTIEQADEIPAMRFNLERNSKARPRAGTIDCILDIPILEMNFLCEGLPLPSFGVLELPTDPKLLSDREEFQRKYLVPGWRNRGHVILAARHNLPARPAWYMNFVGDKGLWEFVRDPWTKRSEQLWFAKPRSVREGKRELDDLRMAPIAIRNLDVPARRPLIPSVVLRNVDLEMEARANGTCRYVTKQTFIPQLANMKMLSLDLVDTFFESTRRDYLALTRHTLKLAKVTQDGQSLRFDHRENELLVELARPSELGVPILLQFEVEGDFLIHPGGDNRWELGETPWLPSTEFEGMRFTGTCKIRSEKPFTPLASGRVISRGEEGGNFVLETRMDQPTIKLFIVAGDYYVEEDRRDGLTVRVASYAHKSDSDLKLARLAHNIVRFYEPILGPFPVTELNIVQRNEYGSGQAPSGFLFITNEAFNSMLAVQDQWFSRGINQRIAHEIAHQYWGNQVMIASMDENWISEGFAQYCSALVIRSGKGELDFKNLLASWASKSRDQASLGTLTTLWRIQEFDDPMNARRIQQALLYGKGPVVLHRIHTEIGDQAFATLMRSLQKSLKGRPGTSQDVINLIKLITKRDYTAFFEKCVWGTDMPD